MKPAILTGFRANSEATLRRIYLRAGGEEAQVPVERIREAAE